MEVFEFIKTTFAISLLFSWFTIMVSFLYFIKSVGDSYDYEHIVISIILLILSSVLYFNAIRAYNHIKIDYYKQTIQYIEKK